MAVEFNSLHDAMRHYYRGRVFESTGETDIAIEEYEKAIEMGADYADVFNCLGRAYEAKGFLDRAYSSFQTALKKNPHYLEAQRNLSDLQGKLDLHKREQILKNKPDNNSNSSKMSLGWFGGIVTAAIALAVVIFLLNNFLASDKAVNFIAPSENVSSIVYDGKNAWMSDWEKQEIYKCEIKDGNLSVSKVYHLKDIFPVGLANGINALWTCDSLMMKINKHLFDKDLTVVGSYSMNNLNIVFLCFDGISLWSLDASTRMIHKHNMADTQLVPEASYPSGCSKPLGLFFDGKNYWSFDADKNYLYKYDKNFSIDKKYMVTIPANKINAAYLDNKYLWLVFDKTLRITRYPRKMFIK